MTTIEAHLSVEELEKRYRGAETPIAKSHYQAIWLLAQGHEIGDVAELLAFSARWVRALVGRYNADGPEALGDQRVKNGTLATVLSAAALSALRERLQAPPADGGLWTGPKVAAFLAQHHGLAMVHAQRGWEALKKLGYSIQVPRPRHAQTADAGTRAAFKKSLPARSARKPAGIRACRSRCGRATSIGSG